MIKVLVYAFLLTIGNLIGSQLFNTEINRAIHSSFIQFIAVAGYYFAFWKGSKE